MTGQLGKLNCINFVFTEIILHRRLWSFCVDNLTVILTRKPRGVCPEMFALA